MIQDFSLNGILASSFNLFAKKLIPLPTRTKRDSSVIVPGRSGQLNKKSELYDTGSLSMEMNFISNENEWDDKMIAIQNWLEKGGRLEVSNYEKYFFTMYKGSITSITRSSERVGTFNLEFECDPYYYLKEGEYERQIAGQIFNPYKKSAPLYIIEGSGECDLNINGYNVDATINGRLFIDVQNQIAYNDQKVNQSNVITGDYKEMTLLEGDNVLTVTDGFTLRIIPRWRC